MKHILLTLIFIPSTVCDTVSLMCYRDASVDILSKQEKCLATMVYGEARGEEEKGMIAVAYTAVNRAANKTVCGVILSPKQYSIFNDNPTLRAAAVSKHLEPYQHNVIDKASWDKALKVAKIVINKSIKDPTNGATHYLSPKLMKSMKYRYPKWSKQYKVAAVIGNHKFYKLVDKTNIVM